MEALLHHLKVCNSPLEEINALIGISGPSQPVQLIPLARIGLAPLATFPVRRFPTAMSPGLMEELFIFQLNEGRKLQKRNLSTMGFRVFPKSEKEQFDYEVESMYQVGEVDQTNHFAHRHHGEVGYSFATEGPLRFVYLFDYSSGDRNSKKNFDFLFAKRRAEYGPSGILGIIFPSNIFSPLGFRSTLQPISTVRLMVSYRTFWLADGRGPFVGSGLQDPTGRAGTFLGNMLDSSITWAPQAGYFRHTTFEVDIRVLSKASISIECHKVLARPMSIMSIPWRH